MKIKTVLLGLAMGTSLSMQAQTASNNGYPYGQVPFTAVKITPNSFWGDRIHAAREVTIPLAFSKCESEHRYKNFEMAAYTLQHPGHEGLKTQAWDVSKFMGFSFDDTDVYKTIEGASYVLQTYPDEQLKAYIDSVLDVVAAAQEKDGYLYTARTINPQHPHAWSKSKRWENEEDMSHELYNLGHMVDAACAHYQATGSTKFLDIAKHYADCVCREVGAGKGQALVVPGHQIAEMALARLYVLTGEKKYLDEAKFLLDYRGKTDWKRTYSQSHQPVVDQKEAVGHAVRAGYMYAGMADVAALTGDSAYINAIDAICDNIITKKYYITGSVGARHDGEAFGDNYELPNLTAYNETCAAISMVYLFQRMFLLHGDAKYIDCLERTLYNGVISGMSVDGGRFFYPNPLSADGHYKFNADHTNTRQPWFGCACCPSNLCRFIPSMPGYIYGVKDRRLYVNLFAANSATIEIGGKEVTLEQETNYPWDGDIALVVKQNKAKAFAMAIRIPGWVRGEVVPTGLYHFNDNVQQKWSVTVNGESVKGNLENGYLIIDRKWKKNDRIEIHFDMDPRMVVANKLVKDDRGMVAVERGPLVYCAESFDNQDINVHQVFLGRKPVFHIAPISIVNTEADGKTFSVTGIQVSNAQELRQTNDGSLSVHNIKLQLIPYYAWNHRGVGRMDVWFNNRLNQEQWTVNEVKDVIRQVNTYWQTNNKPQVRSFWDHAAYHTGNMEVYKLLKDQQMLDYSIQWAEHNKWMGATEPDATKWQYKKYGEKPEFVLFGDWQICFQTYIDLYNLQPDEKKVARAKEVMGYIADSKANDYWWWADALYMVMPVMTKMYKLTGEQKYLDKLYENLLYSDGIMLDEETGLYFRDGKYIYPKHKTASGKKDFWARGDGWVLAGLAKVLQDMPKDYVHQPFFAKKFQKMAQTVKQLQQPEGHWTRSMMDPQQAPGYETSGTAFFCYGLLWGVNNGYLSKADYAETIAKAWEYLTTVALQQDGKIGYVQPIGERAIPGQRVGDYSQANFGVGAFLLAACEYVKYISQ